MANVHRVRKGYNLQLVGNPSDAISTAPFSPVYTLFPADFKGVTPKLAVKVGDKVLAGDCVFYSKTNELVRIPSPVSGEVLEIVRGEKRVLLAVKIAADAAIAYRDFGSAPSGTLEAATVKEKLTASGLWTLVRMRPFDRIANPSDSPKAIFINGMATAPHAPSIPVCMAGQEESFQAGIEALSTLSDQIVLSTTVGDATPAFQQAKGVEKHSFSGPHPSGNTSVHIAAVSPLNKGEVVWAVSAQDVVAIGKLFTTGQCRLDRVISLTGECVKNPQHYSILPGAGLKELLVNQLVHAKPRIISGDVLTGIKTSSEGALHFYSQQVSTLPEGDSPELLGWVLPGVGKFSLSRTFCSWLTPNKSYALDTNMHGEERAFVITGQYEQVFPFDIFPQELVKAAWSLDVEKLEQLGIYEVVEEDFALCEVICTSKQPLQELIREALDTVYTEMN